VSHTTMPFPWTIGSPDSNSISRVSGVPTGRGSRVWTKIPPREMLRA